MDVLRFDHLARVLGDVRERRALLRVLLGAAVGGALTETAAKTRGKARGVGGKRRKHTGKRRGSPSHGGSPPEPRPGACCGTAQCGPPEPGSTRSECDYGGRFFAAHDFNGSIFRGIDGRGTDFTAADLHGSVFAAACLQGASFRSARLGGSTWGDACLFGADFTGADLGGDSATFGGALFCGTTMPDGSINDRDCNRATACCQRPDPAPECQSSANCPEDELCCRGHCCFGSFCCGAGCCDEGETCCGGFCCDCCDEGQCC